MSSTRRHLMFAAFILLVRMGSSAPADAAVCDVPSPTYSTIQSAVDDPQCTEIDVAAGSYEEVVVISRSLMLSGAGSEHTSVDVPAGQPLLSLAGPSTVLEVHGISFGCLGRCPGFAVTGGGVVSGTDTEFLAPRPLVFAADFDDGTTDEWSQVIP